MIPVPHKGDELVTIEGVRERLAEPLDFMQLLMAKLTSAMFSKHGTKIRQLELDDVHRMLSPYRDEKYVEDRKKALSDAQIRKTRPSEFPMWETDYQGEVLEALIKLMKRNDLLPKGKI